METKQEEKEFRVVVNQDNRHSLWPFGKLVPTGWKPLEVTGDKEACLEFIRGNWDGTEYPGK